MTNSIKGIFHELKFMIIAPIAAVLLIFIAIQIYNRPQTPRPHPLNGEWVEYIDSDFATTITFHGNIFHAYVYSQADMDTFEVHRISGMPWRGSAWSGEQIEDHRFRTRYEGTFLVTDAGRLKLSFLFMTNMFGRRQYEVELLDYVLTENTLILIGRTETVTFSRE